MKLLSKLKSMVGLNGSGRDHGGTSVTVEREPAAERERAVKEPVSAADGASDGAAEAAPEAAEPVDVISGIGHAYADRLGAAGVETVEDLAGSDATELHETTDIGQGRLAGWIQRARDR